MHPKSNTSVLSNIQRMIMSATVGVALITAAWPETAAAQRQEIIQLQADVVNLEQRVIEIQRSLDQRNASLQSLVEQMSDTVGSLSSTMDRIATTLEDVRAGSDRVSAELRVAMANLGDDMELVERSLTEVRANVAAVSQQMTSLSATTQDLGSPDSVFRNAYVDLTGGRYGLAREGFRDFLQAFPTSPDAALAQMYLGDAWRGEGDNEQAIIEYDFLLQKYPGSDRTADALYKKGLSLGELGQTAQARDVFEQIIADFPNSANAVRAQEELENLDGGD